MYIPPVKAPSFGRTTYNTPTQLGCELVNKSHFEETKTRSKTVTTLFALSAIFLGGWAWMRNKRI